MWGIRYGRDFAAAMNIHSKIGPGKGLMALAGIWKNVSICLTLLTGFAFKAVRRKESAGDLWGLPLTEGGGRSRDGKIRPGLSRFANGQDNSGAGGRGNTAQRFALERIGQSAVCIYLKKTGFLYSDI